MQERVRPRKRTAADQKPLTLTATRWTTHASAPVWLSTTRTSTQQQVTVGPSCCSGHTDSHTNRFGLCLGLPVAIVTTVIDYCCLSWSYSGEESCCDSLKKHLIKKTKIATKIRLSVISPKCHSQGEVRIHVLFENTLKTLMFTARCLFAGVSLQG